MGDAGPGITYDDEDKSAAAINMQRVFRGHAFRRKLWACLKLQAAGRSRGGRRKAAEMRDKKLVQEQQTRERQKHQRARANRLRRCVMQAA